MRSKVRQQEIEIIGKDNKSVEQQMLLMLKDVEMLEKRAVILVLRGKEPLHGPFPLKNYARDFSS